MKRLTTQFDDTRLRATVATPTCSSCCCCCCCLATIVGATVSEVVNVGRARKELTISTGRTVVAVIVALISIPAIVGLAISGFILNASVLQFLQSGLIGGIAIPVLFSLLTYVLLELLIYRLILGRNVKLKRISGRYAVIATLFTAELIGGFYAVTGNGFSNNSGSGAITYLVVAVIGLPFIIILLNRVPVYRYDLTSLDHAYIQQSAGPSIQTDNQTAYQAGSSEMPKLPASAPAVGAGSFVDNSGNESAAPKPPVINADPHDS